MSPVLHVVPCAEPEAVCGDVSDMERCREAVSGDDDLQAPI